MNEDARAILRLTNSVADSDRPVTSFGMEMLQLSLLLRKIADSHSEFAASKGSNSPSSTETGVALDPWRASLSLDDRGRTAAFIRGCVLAVESLLATRPKRPIHVIEAGCGPLAALSIPLMSRFGPEQLQVTLIDIHQKSIDTARHVVDRLELSDRLRNTICDDLMVMDLADNADVVVLETMYAALFREPQVALMRRLVRRLPSAIFVPESISVDLQLLDLQLECSTIPPAAKDRQMLGRVFQLDRSQALNVKADNGRLPAATITLPAEAEPGQGLYLTTSMVIVDDVVLLDYDAEITAPVAIPDAQRDWLGRKLNFRYCISECPGLEWEISGD